MRRDASQFSGIPRPWRGQTLYRPLQGERLRSRSNGHVCGKPRGRRRFRRPSARSPSAATRRVGGLGPAVTAVGTASRLRRAGRSGHACRLGDGTRAGGSRGKSLPSAGCATKSRARETTGGRWVDVVSRRSARSQSALDSGLRCRARNRQRSGLDGGRPAANATMSVSNRPRVVQAGEQDSRQADLFNLPTRDNRRKREDAEDSSSHRPHQRQYILLSTGKPRITLFSHV